MSTVLNHVILHVSHRRFSNRHEFVKGVREFRLSELACEHRVQAVRCGFASVIPLEVLNILTDEDLDLRVCGIPYIDLEYLKVSQCPLAVVTRLKFLYDCNHQSCKLVINDCCLV